MQSVITRLNGLAPASYFRKGLVNLCLELLVSCCIIHNLKSCLDVICSDLPESVYGCENNVIVKGLSEHEYKVS